MFKRYSRERHQDAFYLFLKNLYVLLPKNISDIIYVADTYEEMITHEWLSELNSEKIVVLAMGCENHIDLSEMYKFDKVKSIIRCYAKIDDYKPWPPPIYQIKNGIPVIPTNEDPRTIVIPISPNVMEDRLNLNKQFRLNFTGQVSGSRIAKLQSLSSFFNNDDLLSVFEGWGALKSINEMTDNVLTHSDYIKALSASKVALCFAGHSHETHRHIEAAMQGCAIVTDPLPDVDFYNAAPFVRTIGWNKAHLEFAITNYKELGEASYAWYNDYASPKAVSKRICQRFEELGL